MRMSASLSMALNLTAIVKSPISNIAVHNFLIIMSIIISAYNTACTIYIYKEKNDREKGRERESEREKIRVYVKMKER